ncbi:unnamed protein product [Bursaphelenchus okinawaensis]|uniref:Amino acid transporter transmembrane domain-containing protein n=1 Tax=Bursaphelenchus okinawaensis TaxID=465554 RepID=A0A811KAB2_9BILA|nr:unnamed protein product [Bursaphelenchus okinawaensis]CAG9099376.1 unnamed protein product [Bursaphelenchus okinawaensis]
MGEVKSRKSTMSTKKTPTTTSTDAPPNFLEKPGGMGWVLTALLLAGELAGAGVISLPMAVRSLGFYFGLLLIILSACMCVYTSVILGRSWVILQKYWPKYRRHCRDPYAQIGYKAYGAWMKTTVALILNLGTYGSVIILVVICSKNMSDAIKQFWQYDFDYCFSVICIVGIITPFCLFKSPQDFWWIIVAGMLCTFVAVFLALGGIAHDIPYCKDTFSVPAMEYNRAFGHVGNLLLAFAGHFCYPTIQNDMRQPTKFGYSAALAYSMITMLYFPIALFGNIAYNDNVSVSVINNLQIVWIQQSANLLITFHCMIACILVMNPVNQTIEEYLNFPHNFGPHRICVRVGMMILTVCLAETFPEFGPLMGIAGGILVCTTSFLFPAMFYLKLNILEYRMSTVQTEESEDSTSTASDDVLKKITIAETLKETKWYHTGPILLIFVIGCFVMVTATIFASKDLATVSFKMPCYLRWIKDWEKPKNITPITCCGKYSNITLDGRCIKSNLFDH